MAGRKRRVKKSHPLWEVLKRAGFGVLFVFILVGAFTVLRQIASRLPLDYVRQTIAGQGESASSLPDVSGYTCEAPEIDEQLLSINEYSRPGLALNAVNGIVIHYTGNPGSSAKENRDYFENLKDTHTTKASSNFIIGLEGEIIRCVPENEMSYASNSRNSDTLSIECCHPSEDGAFTEATYDAMVRLSSYLICKYDIPLENMIRHYDITGKNCPKYFVENEGTWEKFRADVAAYITDGDTPHL